MNPIFYELCAESLEAAQAAEAGGADRIELCSDLASGGITPDASLLSATLQALTIPVHVLIRPRGGGFVFNAEEFAAMRRQVVELRQSGVAGIVTGVLRGDGRIDVERSRTLVELARPLSVTFHRAFDETPNLQEALQDVIRTGADCLLTSGGAAEVLAGAEEIARLRILAEERIQIIAGGGLKLENLAEVLRRTGIISLHGSLLRRGQGCVPNYIQLQADVRQAVQLLQQASARAASGLG